MQVGTDEGHAMLFTQGEALSILTHAPAEDVKALAEMLLSELGDITVLKNRTGLVMLPYTDSSQGTVFHLGEVLVAEAHIRLDDEDQTEGYGMVVGRDLTFAMAIAVIDAAISAEVQRETIENLLTEQQTMQAADDEVLLRKVESTRVNMETF
jgi:alpha-D-ribose 1-methylphosphonate 5-triphosphate synthase subunit PhnG